MIPDGWSARKLDSVLEERKEKTSNISEFPLYSLTIENGLTEKTDRYERSFLLKDKKNNEYRVVYPNDILFNPMNLRFGAIAKSNIDKIVSVSAYYNILRGVDEETDIRFLIHLLSSNMMIQIYDNISLGSLVEKKRVHLSMFQQIKVSLPPLPEQKKIASILSSVDDAIQATQKVIDKTELVKQGLLQELLTKGINHTEFKKTEIGEIPVEWKVATIGEYSEVIDPQPDHRTPPTVNEGIPYIGMADIKDGKVDFNNSRTVSESVLEKQSTSFSISEGAFVFGKIGTIGFPTRIPKERNYAYSANLILLSSSNTTFINLLYWLVQSPIIENQIKNQTNTTSQPALGIKKVRNFKIPVPCTSEQLELNSIFSSLHEKFEKNIQVLSRLYSLKKGLMQDLLTGKVRV